MQRQISYKKHIMKKIMPPDIRDGDCSTNCVIDC
jgi:hypothetical protein